MSAEPLAEPPVPSQDPAGAAAPGVAGGALLGPGVSAPTLSGAGRRFLSDILVELGFVDQTAADQAVESARRPGMTPEKVLLESDHITADQLARALAERYAGAARQDLMGFERSPYREALQALPDFILARDH